MAGFIGPALPPELQQNPASNEEKGELIGPALPPGLQRNFASNEEKGELIGPALPKPSDGLDSVRIGPELPPGFCNPTTSESSEGDLTVQNKEKSQSTMYGPALPPGLDRKATSNPNLEEVAEENDPDDVIGPMPLMGGEKSNEGTSELDRRKTEIESRAKAMRDRLTGMPTEPEQPKREEWMTELPPEFKPLGLGPRKFRTKKSDTGDRSVWTDTPADRLKRAQGQQTNKKKAASETYAAVLSKDRELTEQVAKYNEEYRSESLMEMHRKRRAEERDAGETERRPFNRETDLDLPKNLVTPAKRQALMKDSAKSLASKFTHGKQSFL